MSNNNKSYQIWLPILLSIFMVIGLLIGMNLNRPHTIIQVDGENTDTPIKLNGQTGRVEEVLRYIDAKYVDDVNRDELVENAISKLLDELDPHSNYIPAEDLQRVNESLEGNFVGIGIEFEILKDTLLVLRVIPDGPSDKAGLVDGDKIVKVDGQLSVGDSITTKWVSQNLRGEKGSSATLSIKRAGQKELLDIKITRDEIAIHSVDVAFMLNKKTGYIKINRFSDTTYDEFMKAMDKLEKDNKVEDLVIDLRQNPGGYLREATRILNQLIKERNVMLVYTEGEHSAKKEYKTKGAVKYQLDDIAVLIDGGSASASEIMAGALQDNDRAIVVGRRSFGKGLVQEQYDLSDGGALRLTTARYYTKSGRLIQKKYEDGAYEEEADRFDTGELVSKDSIRRVDSTEYLTSNGRVVYGGNGIIPDVFVPINKMYTNNDFINWATLVNPFVYQYIDGRRAEIKKMGIDKFAREYQLPNAAWQQFLALAKKEGKGISASRQATIEAPMKERIKQTIARNVFGMEGYYKVRNLSDPVLLETMKKLDNSEVILEGE